MLLPKWTLVAPQSHKVDFLVHVVTAAGLSCTVEERVGNDRPGDLCIRRWKDGKVLMVDVTVRHPLAPSVPLNHTQEELLIGAEKEKSEHYTAACEQQGSGFTPFAISTFGALGPGSADFLFELESLYAATEPSKEVRGALRFHLGQGLQNALKREVARMLLGSSSASVVFPGSDSVDPRQLGPDGEWDGERSSRR